MSRYGQILFLGASVLTLSVAGCMNGTNGSSSAPEGEATAFAERPSNSRLVERDVEAPEVFQVTDQGLWDGRPSLGGVWVAYPDVKSPERVIIRNESNGMFVIGALFKREREHPGPKLQVSSDAAASLGLLAGQPTPLNVTALRREEPAPIEEAVAPAATEAVVAAEVMEGEFSEDAATDQAALGADLPVVASAEVAAVEPVTTKKKRSWNPFRRKQPAETVTSASADADAAAVSAAAVAALSAAPVAVTTEALPSIAGEAAAAPEAIAETRSSKVDKPYIQIGIFSVESNANSTAEALRQNGLAPKVFEQESSGKTFWRVVAGPASSTSDRAALLKKVKGMGFADAYPVGG